jgi:hypothetical protein
MKIVQIVAKQAGDRNSLSTDIYGLDDRGNLYVLQYQPPPKGGNMIPYWNFIIGSLKLHPE